MVSFFVTFLFILAGSFSTRWLVQHKKISPVRVSSGLTLLAILLGGLLYGEMRHEFSSAFLGGTFVGMTDHNKFSSMGLLFADLIYALLFFFILPFNIGLGGALGLAAVISCLLIHTFFIRVFPMVRRRTFSSLKID